MASNEGAGAPQPWTLERLDEKLQGCRSPGGHSIILSGATVGSPELSQLLSFVGLNEAILKEPVAKADSTRTVRGGATLFSQPVEAALEFEITDEDLSITLTAALPSALRISIPSLQWGIGNVKVVLSVTGPALLLPLVSIVLIADIQKDGHSILDENNEPARVTLIPASAASGWRLQAAHIPLPQLHQIAELLGIQAPPIPPGLDKLGGLSIRSMDLEFTPGNLKPDSVAVVLGTAESWKIIPNSDVFSLNKVSFFLSVAFQRRAEDEELDRALVAPTADGPSVSAAVGATVEVKLKDGQSTLDLPVRIAYDAGEWRMGIYGAHGFPSFGDLIEKIGGADAAAMLPDAVGKLGIEEATVEVILGSGTPTLRSFFFAVRLNDWPIIKNGDLTVVALKRIAFEFTVDRVGGGISGFVTGAICLGDVVDITVTAEKESKLNGDNGWQFTGATGPGQEISIGKLIKVFDQKAEPPPVLNTVSIENLSVSFNTAPQRFTFTCEGKISLGDSGPKLSCKVNIDIAKDSKTFGGTITIGAAEFAFDIKSDQATELDATWKYDKNLPRLELTKISDSLPDLSDLQTLLLPESAGLKLNLKDGERKLSLDCATGAVKLAFLLAQDARTTPPKWIAALGLKPAKISTADMGPLGSALQPHKLALNKLVIVAASDNAPDTLKLPLDKQEYPLTKGLFLQGFLEFDDGSLSYDFECRLGSDKETANVTPRDGGNRPDHGESPNNNKAGTATTAPESKNNVAVGRTIGPVTFRKARFESRDKRVYLLLDASFGSGGFDLERES